MEALPESAANPQMIRTEKSLRPSRPHSSRRPPTASGFTLFEVTLTMLFIVLVLTGLLALFDSNSELARNQTHLANMQQSLRIAQYNMVRNVRMTGRGPLLQTVIGVAAEDRHDIMAVALRNNVGPDEHIAVDDTTSPLVVEGTDVLTIRGVLNDPLYQFDPIGAFSIDNPSNPTEGTLIIDDKTPTGIPHDLEPLQEMIDGWADGGYQPEALLLVSPLDDAIYAVVEIQQDSSYTESSGEVTQVILQFKVTGGTYTDEFNAISAGGSYPTQLATAAFAGILEEYRYYIREEREIPGDDSSRLSPRLSRARVYPGTEVAYLGEADNLDVDIADNVLDLQVALGIDTEGDEVLVENEPPDGEDDWLFNSDSDDSTEAKYTTNLNGISKLFYVRINTLVRTDRQDRGFEADLLTVVEDKDYSASPGDEYNTADQRAFRRRWMQTVVDTRNIS